MLPRKFQTIGERRKALRPFYEKQGSIYCKAIQDNVVFNNHGWKHLVYHSNGRKRLKGDANLRLDLVTWIPEVVKHCKTVRKTNTETKIINGVSRTVIYFELCRTCSRGKLVKKKFDVVVVLRKIENGPIHYWTVRYDKKQKSP